MSKKILTVAKADPGRCRLYVKDQDGSPYVLVDHGRHYEKWNLFRYELYTHTSAGEPDCPLTDVYWELPDAAKHLSWNRGGDVMSDRPEIISNREVAYRAALSKVDLSSLDALERRWYEKFNQENDKAGALAVIVNSVEGDFSQLSTELARIAEQFQS